MKLMAGAKRSLVTRIAALACTGRWTADATRSSTDSTWMTLPSLRCLSREPVRSHAERLLHPLGAGKYAGRAAGSIARLGTRGVIQEGPESRREDSLWDR